MRYTKTVFLILAFSLYGHGVQANQNEGANDDQRIEHLVNMLSGDFDAGRHIHDQRLQGVAENQLDTWASRAFSPMKAPEIGKHVMLSSSYNRRNGEWHFDEFEFLVWNLVLASDKDEILMTPRSPLGSNSYELSARIPGILDGIKPGGLVDGIGGAVCPIRWKKTDYGYRGMSQNCLVMSVSQKKMLNWNWVYLLREDRLEIELAGRDKDTGALLFGTKEGRPATLYRLSDISEYEAARYMLENRASEEDVSTAEALLLDVLKINPNHAGANMMLAYIQVEKGKYEEAEAYLAKAQAMKSVLSREDQFNLKNMQRRVDDAQ